ncbi:MAG: DUF4019 domain-containing protein [Gemmatimonadales bacterium]
MRPALRGVAFAAMISGIASAGAWTPALAQDPSRAPDSAITAAEHAAARWFALLSDGNYAASWEQASRYFLEHVSREQWAVNAERLDRQFRRAALRKLVEARWLEDEPPLPHAEYVVLRWLTVIDEFHQVGERVIMSHEPDGSWRPATYDLFPNVDGIPVGVPDHGARVPPPHSPPVPRAMAPGRP